MIAPLLLKVSLMLDLKDCKLFIYCWNLFITQNDILILLFRRVCCLIECHLVSTATLYSVWRKPNSDMSIKVSSWRKQLSLVWMRALREVHKVPLELSCENQSCHRFMDIKRYNPENISFFLDSFSSECSEMSQSVFFSKLV